MWAGDEKVLCGHLSVSPVVLMASSPGVKWISMDNVVCSHGAERTSGWLCISKGLQASILWQNYTILYFSLADGNRFSLWALLSIVRDKTIFYGDWPERMRWFSLSSLKCWNSTSNNLLQKKLLFSLSITARSPSLFLVFQSSHSLK